MMKRYQLPNGETWKASHASPREISLSKESAKSGASSPAIVVESHATTIAIHAQCDRIFHESPGHRTRFWIQRDREKRILSWHGGCIEIREMAWESAENSAGKGLQPLRLTMPGKVVAIKVKVGDCVEKGQCLLVVEAMKMENNLLAAAAAKIKTIHVQQDDRLESGAILVTFEAP